MYVYIYIATLKKLESEVLLNSYQCLFYLFGNKLYTNPFGDKFAGPQCKMSNESLRLCAAGRSCRCQRPKHCQSANLGRPTAWNIRCSPSVILGRENY